MKWAVRGLRQLSKESEENRLCIVSTGAPLLLVSLLWANPSEIEHEECDACEDALFVLGALCRTSSETRVLVAEPQKLTGIVWHLRYGCTEAKLSAATLIRTLFKQDDTGTAVGKVKGLFPGLVSLLTEDLSIKAEKSAVKALERACRSIANRVKALDAGALDALVDLLIKGRKTTTERALATLKILCETAEGKEMACRHPSFIPVVIERMVRVSHRSAEHATSCMLEVCSIDRVAMMQLALKAGIYQQLLLVLQCDGTPRAKCKAQELLKRLHAFSGCAHE